MKAKQKPHNGFCTIVWRKVAECCKNPHDILLAQRYHITGILVKDFLK
ncbi:hypothetical protein FAEPRAA2165_01234 [Faecalibacterium duncaniae]|uniref:Uncharacterized protein n=1 Tax=Faecalibacterium duncaniae (strain DSM 17677 / JCM 31915 / A2-165) TaxID=411483 RepID=C7H4L9_FAED2|nr:hypothetical protein FAEPRAA2165_01234 [Faecalibacterium duncaniae]